jgi:hypothetical protein
MEPKDPQSETARLPTSITSALATCALLSLAIFAIGPQRSLATICTELMYGWGWWCFAVWLTVLILAMPFRVHGSGPAREIWHGVLWALALGWWFVASVLADLIHRADLLWLAYLTAGGVVFLWRCCIHRWILRIAVRRSLWREVHSVAVLRLVGAGPVRRRRRYRSVCSSMIDLVARFHHGVRWWRNARTFLFGAGGSSAIVLEEAMRHVDGKADALRVLLARDSGVDGKTLSRAARHLALAFQCEVEICLAVRPYCREARPGVRVQLRAVSVGSNLAMAATRGGTAIPLAFVRTLQILAEHESLSGRVAERVGKFRQMRHDSVGSILQSDWSIDRMPPTEVALVRLALASSLARLDLFRLAGGALGTALEAITRQSSEGDPPDVVSGNDFVERSMHALQSEFNRRSIMQAKAGDDLTTSDREDATVLRGRETYERHHRAVGDHPLSGRRVLPSQFAKLPRPARVREIGAGALALAIVLLASGWLTWPYLSPFPGRSHVIRDVPLGPDLSTGTIRSSVLAGPSGAPIALFEDPGGGVRTFDPATYRIGHEGGEDTPLDGTVRGLVANPDGTAVALFDERESGAACVSHRDAAGRWRPIIVPPGTALAGHEIEACIPGLGEPLLLRRDGLRRLLRYDERKRSVLEAEATGSTPIEGRFVDSAERIGGPGRRGTVLLTRAEDGRFRFWGIGEAGQDETLSVRAIAAPPLRERTPVAIDVDGNDRLVVLDSGGGVWRSDLGTIEAPWRRVRPGNQELALDAVELAIVTESGKRLWFLRKGEIWTRRLADASEGPANGGGWTRSRLPTGTTASIDHRSFLLETGRADGTIHLVVPTADPVRRTGSILALSASPRTQPSEDGEPEESIASMELLREGEVLVDADRSGRRAVITVEAAPSESGGYAVRRDELLLDTGRTEVRSMPLPRPQDDLDPPPSIAGILPSREGSLVLLNDGRFIKVDPLRDALLPLVVGRRLFGRIELGPDVKDVALSGSVPAMAKILRRDGSIDESPLGDAPQTPRTIVHAGGFPGNEVLSGLEYVLTDKSGATLFARNSIWRYSLDDAANPFMDLSERLGKAADTRMLIRRGRDRPAIVWISKDGKEIRRFEDGEFSSRDLDSSLSGLKAGLGVDAFAIDGEGWLCSASSDGVDRLLPPQANGPNGVSDAAIRPGFIDFLAADRRQLHSIRRANGAWSVPLPLDSPHSLHSVGKASDARTVLLPVGEGIPLVLGPRGDLAEATRLDKLKTIVRPQVLAEGVIGISKADNAIGWIGVDGQSSDRIASRAILDADLAAVREAITDGNQIFLLGSTTPGESASRIVRTSLDDQPRVSGPVDGATAMELVGDELFVMGGTRLVALAAGTLKPARAWELRGGPWSLGRSLGPPPPLVDTRGVWRPPNEGSRDGLIPVVRFPVAADAAPVEMVAAWGDRVMLLTPKGAWWRRDRPTEPFERHPHLDGAVDAIVLDSPSGSPWARMGGEWISAEDGSRNGRSIGWLGDGSRITVTPDGGLSVGGRSMAGFGRSPTPLGRLGGVEWLDGNRHMLLLGSGGSVILDPESRAFLPTPPELASLKSSVRILRNSRGNTFARSESGLVTALDAERHKVLFGGKTVSEFILDPDPIGLALDGAILDESGRPMADPGTRIDVVQAVASGSQVFRLQRNRRLDRFSLASSAINSEAIQADAIGAIGSRVFALDRAGRRVVEIGGGLGNWIADDWLVGADSIAMIDRRYGLRILGASGAVTELPLREPLPGEVLGNVPGTAVVLTRDGAGRHRLFDLREGRTVVESIPGKSPLITTSGVVAIDDSGVSAISIDARGNRRDSERFTSLEVASSGSGVAVVGLRCAPQSASVVLLDPGNFEERDLIFERQADFASLASTGPGSVRIVSVDHQAKMILTSRAMALDDRGTVQLITNPFGSTDLVMRLGPGEVVASDREGRARRILARGKGTWKLVDEPMAIDPTYSPLWRAFPGRYLDSREAPTFVSLSDGTLDLESGWLIERRPTGLVRRVDRIEVMLADGRMEPVQRLETVRMPGIVAPLSVGADAEISLASDAGNERIGVPRSGERLAVHEIRKAMPLVAGGETIGIDALGQLWAMRGAERRLIAGGLGFTEFCVDETGEPLVRSDRRLWRIVGGPFGATLREETRQIPCWSDHSFLPSSLGSIHWRTPPAGETGAAKWTVELAGHDPLAIEPASRGFMLPGKPQLVMRDGIPWIAVTTGTDRLSAPLLATGIVWGRMQSADGTVAPPLAALPKRKLEAGPGLKASVGEEGAWLEFAGMRFEYREELERFDCQRCRAATGFKDRVITLLGNDQLVSWGRGPDDSLRDPVRIPRPDGLPVGALWPEGTMVVLEVGSTPGDSPARVAWDGKSWSDHERSKLRRSEDAAWSWDDLQETLTVEGHSYRILPERWPRLDFEDVDPAEDRREAPLRSLEDGRIVYRTVRGQWYAVASTGLPVLLDAPPVPMSDKAAVGNLTFARWPTDAAFPLCTLTEEGGTVSISLKVESGLIRDLDGWDSLSQVLRIADDRVLIRMRAAGVHREVKLTGGRLEISPPRLFPSEPESFELGRPIRDDGQLSLDGNHSILRGGLNLGTPGTRGLANLDVKSMVPLALSQVTRGRVLEYAAPGGSRFRVQTDRVLDSVVQTAAEPAIFRTGWEATAGTVELIAESKGGRRFLVEEAGLRPDPIERSRADAVALVRGPDSGLVPQRAEQGALRLVRDGGQPLTVTIRQAAGRITLDHLDADRIESLDDGLMTFSPRWVTRYVRSGEKLGVVSIVPAADGPKPVESLPLGGGLFARHADTGAWELRLSPEADAPSWSLDRFTGPERTYLAGDGSLLQVGDAWYRRSLPDGSIVERRDDFKLELAALASIAAFRDGDILAGGRERWSLDSQAVPTRVTSEGADAAPRRLAETESGPWKLSLARGGDELSIAVLGRRMKAADGSLPIDFAVAVGGNREGNWIIDRFGVEGSQQGMSRWTPHSDEAQESLGVLSPGRLAGLDGEGDVHRVLAVRGDVWRLPSREDPRLVRSDGRLLDSWTSGSRLEIRIDVDGQAIFLRRPVTSEPWFRYPAIDLGFACDGGRFAFDLPVAVSLASSGMGSPPSACIEMRLGWEQFDQGSSDGAGRVLLSEPETVEPQHGAEPRVEWLAASDLDSSSVLAAMAGIGPIRLSFPFGNRLFLLGEERSAWIELDERWRDRPLP